MSPKDMTTMQLLVALQQYILINGAPYLDELNAREIKKGDKDDTTQARGGIRPNHIPLVP
jgi:hypothetical protein